MLRYITCLFLLIGLQGMQAQSIHLRNHSFEGEPKDATVPMGWIPCAAGTTPDILPGYWGVYQDASEGDTFVGLITRPDGTHESISQRLSKTLTKGDCYAFSIDLAHSRTYSGYNQTIKLRIWAGRKRCEKAQLLLETDEIKHTTWKSYIIKFTAEKPINYIILEAYQGDGSVKKMGNILLDNCSALRKCPRA